MKSYPKAATAKTQASKAITKTGVVHKVVPLDDGTFAVMDATEYKEHIHAMEAKHEQREKEKANVRSVSKVFEFSPSFKRADEKYLVLVIGGRKIRVAKTRVTFEFQDEKNVLVHMTSKYAQHRPELGITA